MNNTVYKESQYWEVNGEVHLVTYYIISVGSWDKYWLISLYYECWEIEKYIKISVLFRYRLKQYVDFERKHKCWEIDRII